MSRLVFLVCVGAVLAGGALVEAKTVDLSGPWRLTWTDAGGSEGSQSIQVPHAGSAELPAPFPRTVTYQRPLPQIDAFAADDSLALLIGSVGSVDRVSLNGIRIGGTGDADFLVDAPGDVPRLYSIPKQVIDAGDATPLLSVEVTWFHGEPGLRAGPVLLGHRDELWTVWLGLVAPSLLRDAVLFSVLHCLFGFGLLFWARHRRDRIVRWFLILVAGLFAGLFFDSVSGTIVLERNLFVSRLGWALFAVAPWAAAHFLQRVLAARETALLRILDGLALVYIGVVGLSFFIPSVAAGLAPLFLLWMAALIGWALFIWVKARKNGLPHKVLLVGWVTLPIAALIGLICDLREPAVPSWISDWLIVAGIFIFSAAHGYTVAARYMRLKELLAVVLRRAARAEQAERHRLARDLHDSLGQSVWAARLAVHRSRGREGQDRAEMEARAVEAIEASLQDMRRITFDLSSMVTGGGDCTALIERCAERFSTRTGLPIEVEADVPMPLSEEVNEQVLMVFCEAVANASRHGHAGSVWTSLKASASEVVLEVEDDGVGFDPGAAGEGCGLRNMRDRARLVEGSLEVDSRPGSGTRIRLATPL